MTRDRPLPNLGRSPSGIIHCLHLMAEDAMRLGLPRTHVALCHVLEICEAEHPHNAVLTPSGDRCTIQ
jgi:hypothetical protein